MRYTLAQSFSSALMALENGTMTPDTLPSEPRVALQRRGEQLRLALEPCGAARARVVYATLAAMVARNETNPEVARAVAAQDVADLSSLPDFALTAAATAYRVGQLGDGKWRPTAGELAVEARRRASDHRIELAKINLVLAGADKAKPSEPRVSRERWKELSDMLASVAASNTIGG
jgi:hypothetical protein